MRREVALVVVVMLLRVAVPLALRDKLQMWQTCRSVLAPRQQVEWVRHGMRSQRRSVELECRMTAERCRC